MKKGIEKLVKDINAQTERKYQKVKVANIDEMGNSLEFVKHLKMALGANGISTDDQTAHLILLTVERLKELHGDFSLIDAAEIKTEINNIYKQENAKKA